MPWRLASMEHGVGEDPTNEFGLSDEPYVRPKSLNAWRCDLVSMVLYRLIRSVRTRRSAQHALLSSRLTVGKLKASDVLPSQSTLCASSVRFALKGRCRLIAGIQRSTDCQ